MSNSSRRLWYRVSTEILDDPRILSMPAAMRWNFVAWMCCKMQKILDRDWSAERRLRHVAVKLRVSQEEAEEIRRTLSGAGLIVYETLQPTAEALESLIGPHTPSRPASHIWRAIREFVFGRDDYTCQYCGARGVKLECDHVVPVARGGTHEFSNLVTACFGCNRSKRDKLLSEWSPA